VSVEPGRTAVVVVNYGSHRLLEAYLAPRELPAEVQVVVVDNPTDAAERAAVTALARQHAWLLVCPDRNDGFGPGVNAGAARAIADGCDVVVLVNPDAEVGVDVLVALAAEARARPTAMVAPLVRHADGRPAFSRGVIDRRSGHVGMLGDPQQPLAWLTGAVLAVHASLWQRLGGFSGDYFMYWEDVDLSHRCLAGGGQLAVRQDLTAVHHVGGTQGQGKSHLYYRYNCRNRLLFAARNLERGDVLRWLLATPRESWAILLRGGGRRRLLRDPTSAGAALVGTLDGVRLALRTVLTGARTP
jgi:GT2 family glycosyltransferase